MDVEKIKQKALVLSEAIGSDRVIDVFDAQMKADELSAPDYMAITRLADLYHQIQGGLLSRDEGGKKQKELIEEWKKEIM